MRLRRTILVAVALHGGGLFLLRHLPHASRPHTEHVPLATVDEVEGDAIDVTFDDAVGQVHGEPAGTEPVDRRDVVEGATPRATAHMAPDARGQTDALGEARSPEPAPEKEPPAGVTFGALTAANAIVSDIVKGDKNPFLGRGMLPEPKTEPKPEEKSMTLAQRTAAATRRLKLSLRRAAKEREHELGLGPEGPVLSALRGATSASRSPVTGRATFLARANQDGVVTAVKLLDCDGGEQGWLEAATLAFHSLQLKRLRIPSYARFTEMTIEITSGWKMPNGHDPGTDVTAMDVPVHRGAKGKNGTTMDIVNLKVDRVRIARDLEIPVPSTRIDVVATNGDSSNLGAKPRRIVHTRLLDVKML